MYELTDFLIAISSIAASFVAILGGFIVSKLLAITAERESVEYDLEAKSEEREHLVQESNNLQYSIDENEALYFIREHIEPLIGCKKLDDVFDTSEQNSISIDSLKPFWDKAIGLVNELNYLEYKNEKVNSDNIPITLAQKYSSDDFSYEILKEIMDYVNRKPIKNSLFDIAPITPINVPSTYWTAKTNETIEIYGNQIRDCDFAIEQLKKKKQSLIIPKGIVLGLLIFAIYTIASIIVPLCFYPYVTDNYRDYCIVKSTFIGFFSLGLIAIFCYLIYLLKWKKVRKKESK